MFDVKTRGDVVGSSFPPLKRDLSFESKESVY